MKWRESSDFKHLRTKFEGNTNSPKQEKKNNNKKTNKRTWDFALWLWHSFWTTSALIKHLQCNNWRYNATFDWRCVPYYRILFEQAPLVHLQSSARWLKVNNHSTYGTNPRLNTHVMVSEESGRMDVSIWAPQAIVKIWLILYYIV